MEALKLKVEVRTANGHAKHLRRTGLVPAVLYGQGLEATLLQIETKPLQKVLDVAGTHQLIALQIGEEAPRMALAREIQRDVIKRHYIHVDFYAVKMDEKVNARVPLIFVGESPAVSLKGGILTHVLDEIEIECLPGDLIASIEVNVEGLTDFHDAITVADLRVAPSITILSEAEAIVARIETPRLAEAEETASPTEPEVLSEAKKKKEAEE